MARPREFTAAEARTRLLGAWWRYELARKFLSRATAHYLRRRAKVRELLRALGESVPPGPWHPKGKGRGAKGGGG